MPVKASDVLTFLLNLVFFFELMVATVGKKLFSAKADTPVTKDEFFEARRANNLVLNLGRILWSLEEEEC